MSQLPVVEPALHFSRRHPHLVAGAFFFGGFVWDALTLRRIDSWVDNLLLASYLCCLTILIVAQARAESGHRGPWLDRVRPHLRDAVQFCMGALFSAVVIFYWQSASLTRTSTYLLILVALLVANEFVHRRAFNVVLLVCLYYLAASSFLIFFIPVVVGSMGYVTFIASCVVSAALSIGLVFFLSGRGVLHGQSVRRSVGSVVVLFALLNAFYLSNLIPPVPLAMKFGGVFHEVVKTGETYFLTFEKPRWYRFWIRSNDPFRLRPGDQVYCFSAVFAPTDFRETVYHAWQYRDAESGEWMQSDRIGYQVTGGRGGGYRGFTVKRNIEPGAWRVLVEDGRGFVLGRISFDVIRVSGDIGTLVTQSYH